MNPITAIHSTRFSGGYPVGDWGSDPNGEEWGLGLPSQPGTPPVKSNRTKQEDQFVSEAPPATDTTAKSQKPPVTLALINEQLTAFVNQGATGMINYLKRVSELGKALQSWVDLGNQSQAVLDKHFGQQG